MMRHKDSKGQATSIAFKAVKRARQWQPSLQAFARELTGKPNLRVIFTEDGGIYTNGRDIYLVPPMQLGVDVDHDRAACELRDQYGDSQCRACTWQDELYSYAIHEIGHMVFGSFDEITAEDLATLKRRAIERCVAGGNSYPDSEAFVTRLIGQYGGEVDGYMHLAKLVSPWLPVILNGVEDVRVNAAIVQQRPGIGRSFRSQALRFADKGCELADGSVQRFTDREQNSQLAVAIYYVGTGLDPAGFFDEEVEALLNLPKVAGLLEEIPTLRSAQDSFDLSLALLEAIQAEGWFPDPPIEITEEEQTEEQGEGDDSDERESGEDDGSDGSDGSRQDASDGDSDGSDSDGGPGEDDDRDSDGGSGSPDDPGAGTDDSSADEDGPGDDSADCEGDGEGEGAGENGEGEDAGPAGSGAPSADGQPSSGGGAPGAGDGSAPGERGPGQEGSEANSGPDGGSPADGSPARAGDLTPEQIKKAVLEASADLMMAGGHGSDLEELKTRSEAQDQVEAEAAQKEYHRDPHEQAELMKGLPTKPNAIVGEGDIPVPDWTSPNDTIGVGLNQSEFFATAAEHVDKVELIPLGNLNHATWDRPGKREQCAILDALNNIRAGRPSQYDYIQIHGEDLMDEMAPIVRASRAKARVAFAENAASRHTRNQKRGKLYTPTAGRKLVAKERKVFGTKTNPDSRKYSVLIGLDISGSTANGVLRGMKQAAYAQAELCAGLGIDFAFYCHTSWGHYNKHYGADPEISVELYVVKEWDEPWGPEQKLRFRAIAPGWGNLDGHTMEAYAELLRRRTGATDRVLMYYTDGAMPAENRVEETQVLETTLARLKRDPNFHVMGVGYMTDSPKQFGLETTVVNEPTEDIPKVVEALRRKLVG